MEKVRPRVYSALVRGGCDVCSAQTAFHDAMEKAQRPQPKPKKCTEVRALFAMRFPF